VRAITGWEASLWELIKLGERKEAMFRAFNVREGFTKEDDWLPERMFEGILSGPRKGQKVDKGKLREAIDLYYEMVGRNKDGVPTKGKLGEPDLFWVYEARGNVGLRVQDSRPAEDEDGETTCKARINISPWWKPQERSALRKENEFG